MPFITEENIRRIALLVISALLVVASGAGRTDDIEIYFNEQAEEKAELVRSNVLLILDTSNSMNDLTNTARSRMEELKIAVTTILSEMQDVNVGLARYKAEKGGSIIFPIKDIDGKVSEVVGDTGSTAVTEIINTAFIKSDSDDGEEVVTSGPAGSPAVGSVSLTDPVLDAFDFGGTQSVVGGSFEFSLVDFSDDAMEEVSPGSCSRFFVGNNNAGLSPVIYTGDATDFLGPGAPEGLFMMDCLMIGLRFPGVTIPQGATIAEAFIHLAGFDNSSDPTQTTVVGQASGNAAAIPGAVSIANDISSRPQTTSTVDWNVDPACSGCDLQTPNIKTIVQEIVNRSDWAPGNAMFFRFQAGDTIFGTAGANGFTASTTKGANSSAFRHFVAKENVVKHGFGSQFEPKFRVTLQGAGSAVQGQDQKIALRFSDLRIPKGVTITEAKLTLTPSAAPVSPVESEWTIRAEQSGDSPPLSPQIRDISNRPVGGASVKWIVDEDTLETADDPEESPDIKSVIQSIVNRDDWCGGNALTLILETNNADANQTRFIHSRDGNSSLAAKLTYKFGVGATGCVKANESSQTGLSADDAEQFEDDVNTIDDDLDIGFDTESGKEVAAGLRFRNLNIPKGANILSARIVFTSKGVSQGDANYKIHGIDEDNAAAFTNSINNILGRSLVSTSVPWTPENWDTPATSFRSSNIKTIVQEIVNRPGWAPGNAMGFVIEPDCGYYGSCNGRVAETADGDASKSPRLRIAYQSTLETPFKTNRERMIELVNSLPAPDNASTPITPVLVEAAKYWRGEKVFTGKSRSNERFNRLSHPATYCDAAGSCNGATINSTTDQFGVKKIGSCNMDSNPDKGTCKGRLIKGNPRYISPFDTDLTCTSNHQVLISDGDPTSSDNANNNYVKNLIGENCRDDNFDIITDNNGNIKSGQQHVFYDGRHSPLILNHALCAVDLAEFMAENDMSSTIENKQTVKTHTVAFDLNSNPLAQQYLADIANVGRGTFNESENATDLISVFENILSNVKNDPTSFVAPALATNAFNRLLSRNEVYFGLFTPDLARAWDGNVKKYNICVDKSKCSELGSIIDKDNNEAIDSTTDKFKDSSRDLWSTDRVTDGRLTTDGGTGHMIEDFQTQVVYTDKNNSGLAPKNTLLSSPGFELKFDNWNNNNLRTMRDGICKVPDTASGSVCESRMLFLLGKRDKALDTDINNEQRWSVNDVLHSSPVVVTYRSFDRDGDGLADEFFDKLIYGTNDGSLHMINGDTGKEEWRFIPSDFWGQQQQVFSNAEGNHVYGLDVTPTLQYIDTDDDGNITIAKGDKIRAFMASRRGGSGIYALDLTHDIPISNETFAPRFLWRIKGGSGDFPRLGQTWSKPVLATVELSAGTSIENREVLIFGGGYDPSLDNPNTYSVSDHGGTPFMGNAIYIVDPESGELLLAISGSPGGADIVVPGMDYPIPSAVTAFDTDSDGAVDRIYVGDTGGQVWRVDLAAIELRSAYSSAAGETVVGKLADISVDNTPAKQRRFFEPPSVVQVRDNIFSNEENYDYVLMGTGYRPHPLDKTVEDRFYAFRDFQTGAHEMADLNKNNVADATDKYPQLNGNAFTNNDLINVTTTALDSSIAEHRASSGWFYDFTSTGVIGEKVLSRAITTAGIVTFTTFAPEQEVTGVTADPCKAVVGLGKAYNFDILSAGAALDWDNDGALTSNDRTIDLAGGIPSGVIPVFTNEGVLGVVGVEGGAKKLGTLSQLPTERSYWYEDVEF